MRIFSASKVNVKLYKRFKKGKVIKNIIILLKVKIKMELIKERSVNVVTTRAYMPVSYAHVTEHVTTPISKIRTTYLPASLRARPPAQESADIN